MNYGKFFRLNQRTSKIEDGIAIYDYIDLPAYFEDSDSNEMSPKYPISVAITENSVRFRVHYSVYKSGTESPQYDYNIMNDGEGKKDLKHIEEVILGLPYTNDSTDTLYTRIKDIYSTTYPYSIGGTTLIHQLIKERYRGKNEDSPSNNSIKNTLYKNLRNSQDDATSYSTLWLMDIMKEHANVNLYNKNGDIIRFLRKLLLDFMFDLKHSDVFQTSKYYQAMYSGLMSNFYFSALMHKCEYYFYREQIEKILKDSEDQEDPNLIKRIQRLYADELFNAETLWIRDIMNPLAENYFEHTFYKEKKAGKVFKQNIVNKACIKLCEEFKELRTRYEYRPWDSWFASPEEEMQRVCFTMMEDTTTKKNVYHICNAETISEYLQLEKEQDSLSKKMITEKNNNKTAISQWFLKRYSFQDVMHLHLCKHSNIPFFLTIIIGLLCLFFFPNFFISFKSDNNYIGSILSIIYIILWGIVYVSYIRIKKKNDIKNGLLVSRSALIKKRLSAVMLTIILVIVVLFISPLCHIHVIPQIFIIFIGGLIIYYRSHPLHWLSNMHVFFPRLIAAITASWLTLAIGNELFGHFFDSTVSWSTSIWLTLIVFLFVMYELNKKLPFELIIVKTIRCLEIIAISYVISLIVGLFIINFMGERLLERSDAISNFYSQYVDNHAPKQVEDNQYYFRCEEKPLKEITNADLLNYLDKTYIVQPCDKTSSKYSKNHPIATKLKFGNTEFFILRDFLIQFAFIAMFIGIFIQMLFEEKSLT